MGSHSAIRRGSLKGLSMVQHSTVSTLDRGHGKELGMVFAGMNGLAFGFRAEMAISRIDARFTLKTGPTDDRSVHGRFG